MDVLKMERKASDNKYLHRDFHTAMNIALDYIGDRFGEKAVEEYISMYAKEYYSILKNRLKEKGLAVLKEYFEKIYRIEESDVKTELKDGELKIMIEKCPGISHIKSGGNTLSKYFSKTTSTLYKELCNNTPYGFNLLSYDNDTGKSVIIFKRRGKL